MSHTPPQLPSRCSLRVASLGRLAFATLVSASIAVFGATRAQALGFEPNPFPIASAESPGEPFASVQVIGWTTGVPTGFTTLTGSTAASDPSVVLEIEILAGLFDGLVVSASAGPDFGLEDTIAVTGAGFLPGGPLAPTGASIGSPPAASFGFVEDSLAAGGSSPRIYASFASLAPGDRLFAGVVSIAAPSRPGGPSFAFAILGSTDVVPEPRRAGLLAAAGATTLLAGLGRRRRPVA